MSTPPSQLVLVRHGETAWSLDGRHTGTSEVPLTAHGEEQARASGVLLASRVAAGQRFRTVLSSPRLRSHRTAALAGFGGAVVDEDLAEWDYGPVEGRTSAEIGAETGTDWDIFRDGVRVVGPEHAAVPHPTAGETLDDVAARTARVVERVLPTLEGGDSALLFAHGHVLRVLATTWLGLSPTTGAVLELDTASVSLLGFGHGRRTLEGWNASPAH